MSTKLSDYDIVRFKGETNYSVIDTTTESILYTGSRLQCLKYMQCITYQRMNHVDAKNTADSS